MEWSRDRLEQVRGDLALVRHALSGGYFDWASFAAQQAAEKAVQAVLQRLGAELWGHAVAALRRAPTERVRVTPELLNAALELGQVSTVARYPDAHPAGVPWNL